MHFNAVKSYVAETMRKEWRKDFFSHVIELSGFEDYNKEYDDKTDSFDWLKLFLLADCETLAYWVSNQASKLKFNYMKRLYVGRFSKNSNDYVDKAGTYNAYTLFKAMNIRVCPYCEHEFLDVVKVGHGLQTKRTIEFDQ